MKELAQKMVDNLKTSAALLKEAQEIYKTLEGAQPGALGFHLGENVMDEEAYTVETVEDIISLIEGHAGAVEARMNGDEDA